jgi:uncharacterized membrane protein
MPSLYVYLGVALFIGFFVSSVVYYNFVYKNKNKDATEDIFLDMTDRIIQWVIIAICVIFSLLFWFSSNLGKK